jgi:hypothetical protein
VARIDTTAPNVARVWNYLVGGRDNFESDRQAARQLVAMSPAIAEVGPATRGFHRRVIRFLAAEAGVRQFLEIGTGIPAAGTTHDLAQAVAPESRVVYVDNDPVVLAHARALLTSSAEGKTSYIDADAAVPERILEEARPTLDFAEPIALIMINVLNFITSDSRAARTVRTLLDAVAPGSYLVVMHPASDLDPSLEAAVRRWNLIAPAQATLRSREEVAAWTQGLELVEPGVVQLTQWRPDDRDSPGGVMPFYGLVARKP